jgi:actin-related protein 8
MYTQAAAFNETVTPERVAAHMDDDFSWLSIDDVARGWVAGHDVDRVKPADNVRVIHPIRHGMLAITPHWSQQAVKADLADIWADAIEKHLRIPRADLGHYRAVVIIPDMYRRRHVRAAIEVLLGDLGFSAVLLHQESVCATFGAGVSSACVVDVGASKISVSCVDEGVSLEESRITLLYGGNEVTRLFHWLLRKVDFPYKECSLGRHTDWALMDRLKESICHLHDVCSPHVLGRAWPFVSPGATLCPGRNCGGGARVPRPPPRCADPQVPLQGRRRSLQGAHGV